MKSQNSISKLIKQLWAFTLFEFGLVVRNPMSRGLTIACALVTLNACSPGDNNNALEVSDEFNLSTSPVDVVADFVPLTGMTSEKSDDPANQFTNAGFENAENGWFTCDGESDKVKVTSGSSYEGENAMQVGSGGCFYRSVPVTAGDELLLSCYVQIIDDNKWTGLGLGFSDNAWKKLSEAPSAIIGGVSYARYDVKGVVPEGASYASMWFYSETPALVDACSLTELPHDNPPEPPIVTSDNLLENANFDDVTGFLPDSWQQYCGGSTDVFSTGAENELLVYDGACVAQSLNASRISALRGKPFELTCDIQSPTIDGVEHYASIAIGLDGVEQAVVIPTNASQQVRLTNIAPTDISNGYVSIYNEGEPDTLRVSSCSLRILDDTVVPVSLDNLLVNGSFDELDANDKPIGWEKGCGGTWSSLPLAEGGAALSLVFDVTSEHFSRSSCISQTLTADAVAALQGKYYKLECQAWSQAGPTTARFFENLNDGRTQIREIPLGSGWQTYSLEGLISNAVGSPATVNIWSSNDLLIDECSLVTLEPDQVPLVVASIDVRSNLEGRDVYRLRGPYTFENHITNTGEVRLTNIKSQTIRNGEVICQSTLPSLDPGETNRSFCPSDVVVSSIAIPPVEVEFIVTAESYDGSLVQDSDTSGYALSRRPNAQAVLFIEAETPAVSVGETAVFSVNVASTGNWMGVAEVASSEASCAKSYSDRPTGVLQTGEFDVYKCSVPNVQSDFSVSVDVQIPGDGFGVVDFSASDSATVTVE